MLVTSRRFTIPTEEGSCMVPIGDIANSLPRFNLTNRYSESGMEYRAVREIKAGEQVYFNYD